MEHLLTEVAGHIAVVIQALAVLIVVVGVLLALVESAKLVARGNASEHEKRAIWIRFSRWLVAALTVQMAADIVETSSTPSWDEIGRLAAIAAVRTFLSYFLDRDLTAMRDEHEEHEQRSVAPDRRSHAA
ncbi:MAG TPA: DUF1622 domain-containing protein [Polyangiales bacterium]|nr:DUF1622 domain-containing protein [Polyangiales bacterium]